MNCSKVLFLLFMSWNKAWSQGDFRLVLNGFRNGQNILCTASSDFAVNDISLTINGDTNIAQFGYFEGPPANATTLQFFNPSLPSGNNSLVALCHSGNVTSNPFTITVGNRDFIPITLTEPSSQPILDDSFTISCTSNTNEVDPNEIVLRLNGVAINPAARVIGELVVFNLTATLTLNQSVAQCTFGILGSIARTISIRERECGDCDYFCVSTSTCLSKSTFCGSRDNNCLMVMVNCTEVTNQTVCEECGDYCAAGEYYCPASSRCLPEATLCDRAIRCDTCVSEQRTCEVCDSNCSSGEYFCDSALECLSESTLCSGTCISPCGVTLERTCRECTCDDGFYCMDAGTGCSAYDFLCNCTTPCLKNFSTAERCNCNGDMNSVNCALNNRENNNNNMCIPSGSLCNGREECSNGFDEDTCYGIIIRGGFPTWAIIVICVGVGAVGAIFVTSAVGTGLGIHKFKMKQDHREGKQKIYTDKAQAPTGKINP